MDFVQAVRILRRRWYVAAPALLLALVMAAGVYMTIGARYQSTAVIVLTAPGAGGTYSPGTRPEEVRRINPLLAFDGSLTTTAQIVIQILRDPRTAEEIGVDFDTNETYNVNNGTFGGSGPFVAVLSTAASAPRATDLTQRVMDRAVQELRDRQLTLGAPESTLIGSQVLVRPTEAEKLIGGKVRFAGAALLLGIIAALAAPFALESRAQSKNGRGGIVRPASNRGDQDLVPAMTRPDAYARGNGHSPPYLPPEEPSAAPLVPQASIAPRRRPPLRDPANLNRGAGTVNGVSPHPVARPRPGGGARVDDDVDRS